MKKKLKDNSGISCIDLVTSIGIIMIFSTIITLVYANITSSNVKIQRTQIATNYAVALIEKADKLYYDELTEEELKRNMNFSEKYTVHAPVVELESGNNPEKKVSVEIEFKVGKNIEKVKMEKIKTKEILVSPNKPILKNNMTPVRYIGTELLKTNEHDPLWYDYSNKNWAHAILGDDLENVYIWVPNYAVSNLNNDIKFIFGNGVRYVNKNGNLQLLPTDFIKLSDFGTEYGLWKKENDIIAQEMIKRLSLESI